MVFEELLELLGNEPVFESGLLLAGDIDPHYARRQLSEWVRTGKLWQLRRGLYAPAPPYQKTTLHPFAVANRLVPGSYVSLQSALEYYDLIPEHVVAITCVTTRRPGTWSNKAGDFIFRHIRPDLLFGYENRALGNGQTAFVAVPEKAVLDLVYFSPHGDAPAFLQGLRLQNTDLLDLTQLTSWAIRYGKPKLERAAALIAEIAHEEECVEAL